MAARSWIIKAALSSQLIRLQAQTLASSACNLHTYPPRFRPSLGSCRLHNQDPRRRYQNPTVRADAVVRFGRLRRALNTMFAIAES